jgi:hypothetical protein
MVGRNAPENVQLATTDPHRKVDATGQSMSKIKLPDMQTADMFANGKHVSGIQRGRKALARNE